MLRKDRIQKAQEAMQASNIDAYMILTHDDYRYFFGEERFQPRAILPAEGEPIIVAFSGEEDDVRSKFHVDDVRVFGSVGQQIRDVVEVMRELAANNPNPVIGFQLGFATPAFLLMMFRKANPHVTVVNIAPVMDSLRMYKEPAEIGAIREAGRIAAIGMETALKRLAPGVTEHLVATETEYAMRKAGAGGTATPIFVNSGVRSGWLHGTATGKEIETGDLVVIDLVPTVDGYCANLCRTFCVGHPTDRQRELHATYTRAQAAAARALVPGKRIKEIDAVAKAVFAEDGFGERYVEGISHGIGLTFEETPMPTIHPGDAATRIQENMTLTAGHSVLSVPGIGGVRLEDTYLITAHGAEPLTRFRTDLAM
jgi:Xaa-Pro aminopeptidase